ncbi:glycosyltransferase family 4 protein [Methylomonas sp. OY6]|uniref:Glycosyltransferase family 4 protein n=1 Tax=Methylomonas defluvii TaxID=3045149 RepID=A0ABU4UCF4_9GAMM|nr:glycosyltransferase family 4 protein [Methylomonas sp. OY6]MDX8127147.1 glycosyltransferase family 4 protein [Methylomonas sp. OY6]
MNIGIVGPIATEYVADFLATNTDNLPRGYPGAPLMGVLIGQLLKQGHKVSAFTTDSSLYASGATVKASGPNFDFYICPSRPRAWRFNSYRLGRAIDGFAYEIQQLKNAIKLANPEIVHAHWTYEFANATIKAGRPHLITCHDAPAVVFRYTRSLYRAIRYLVARQVFRNGSYFTTVSTYMASSLRNYVKDDIEVVPNPLADYVLEKGAPRARPETRRIGLICNGWDLRKNPKPALEAFAKLRCRQPIAELHLYGVDFEVGGHAQTWCIQQGLNSGMVFHGVTPHKQLIEQLEQLDLLLHPALEESFGVVIAEAMALGLPIVAGQNSGAVPWVVGSEGVMDIDCCAVLTDVSDSLKISAALDEVFDEGYLKRSLAGYLRARKMFSPKAVTDSYLAIYKRILLGSVNE